jgi:hypothetical protein
VGVVMLYIHELFDRDRQLTVYRATGGLSSRVKLRFPIHHLISPDASTPRR